MATTKVQSALQAAGNSKAFASNVVSGNLLTARIVWQGAAGITLNSVTDTQGNTWTIHGSTLQRQPTLTQYMQIASCIAGSSAACTVTATLSSGTAKAIAIDEWNNSAGGLVFDVGSANSGVGSTLNSGSATTTAANGFGIGMCAADASLGGAFTTPDAGWTDQQAYTPYWYANDLYQLDLGAAGSKSAGEMLVSAASKNWACNFAAFKISAGGGGTTYNQSVAGSITGAGALTKRTAKVFTGSSTATGGIAKQTGKAVGGSATLSGAITRAVSKGVSGSINGAGSLVKSTLRAFSGSITPTGNSSTTIVFTQALAGSMTLAGAISKMTLKAVTGSSTVSGAIAKLTNKSLSASITIQGALNRITARAFAGVITATGALSESYAVVKSLAGSITPTGALTAAYIAFVAGVLKLLTMMGIGQ